MFGEWWIVNGEWLAINGGARDARTWIKRMIESVDRDRYNPSARFRAHLPLPKGGKENPDFANFTNFVQIAQKQVNHQFVRCCSAIH